MPEFKFGDNLKIKVIGVGSLGSNCLEHLKSLDKRGLTRIAVGLPSKGLARAEAHKKIVFDPEKRFVSEDDMNEEWGRSLLSKHSQDISNELAGADIAFVVGSLGREINYLAMEHIANIARNVGVVTFGVATKPFFFEGKKRQDMANVFSDNLKQSIDSLLIIPNDTLIKDGLAAEEALTMTDKTVGDCIGSLLEIVFTVGNINIDFNDFKATIERSGAAFLGMAEGERKKLDSLLKRATTNLFFELPFKSAKRVLYLVTASKELTLDELRRVGDFLASKSDREAKIIFGLAVDNKLDNKIKLTLLGCGVEDGESKEPSTLSENIKEASHQKNEINIEANEKSEMDVPAFLRRKMEKEE